MKFKVTFEATGFTNDREMLSESGSFLESVALGITEGLRSSGKLPYNVLGVADGYISEDDAQGDTDIHVFVGVVLLVEAATEAAAESFAPPEEMLNWLAYFIAGAGTARQGLDLDEHSWEVTDVTLEG